MSWEMVASVVGLGLVASFVVWFFVKLLRIPRAVLIGFAALGVLVLGAAAGLLVWGLPAMTSMADSVPEAPRAYVKPPTPERGWREDIKIKASWTTGGFGSVALWDVTVKNSSKNRTYKDLRFATQYAGESGTVVRENEGVLLIIVKPGQTRTVRQVNDGFIPGQVSGADIRITDADIVYGPEPKAR